MSESDLVDEHYFLSGILRPILSKDNHMVVKRSNILFVSIAFVLAVAGSLSACKKNEKTKYLAETFKLDETELIEKLHKIALEGDDKSAYSVAEYYLYWKGDSKMGYAYFRKSADLGNEAARGYLQALEKEIGPSGGP